MPIASPLNEDLTRLKASSVAAKSFEKEKAVRFLYRLLSPDVFSARTPGDLFENEQFSAYVIPHEDDSGHDHLHDPPFPFRS